MGGTSEFQKKNFTKKKSTYVAEKKNGMQIEKKKGKQFNVGNFI